MEYITELTLDVNLHKELPTVRVKQGDASTRKLLINLKKDGNVFIPDSGSWVLFRCEKPDGHAVLLDSRYQDSELGRYLVVNNGDGTISVELVAQVTVVSGSCRCDICLLKNEEVLSSIPFVIEVKRSPNTAILSESSDDRRSLIYTSDIADGAVTEEKLSSDLIEKIDGGGGGGTSDYTALSNKPQINGVTLSGNKSTSDLGLDRVFWAVVGSTHNDAIHAAHEAGKIVLIEVRGYIYQMTEEVSSTKHRFTCADQGTVYWLEVSNDLWGFPTSRAIPAEATSAPSDLGTAAVGSSAKYAKEDHVHNRPTYSASDVGAIAAPSSPATGAFLVWNGTAWVAQTLSTWSGGSY